MLKWGTQKNRALPLLGAGPIAAPGLDLVPPLVSGSNDDWQDWEVGLTRHSGITAHSLGMHLIIVFKNMP